MTGVGPLPLGERGVSPGGTASLNLLALSPLGEGGTAPAFCSAGAGLRPPKRYGRPGRTARYGLQAGEGVVQQMVYQLFCGSL